MKVPYSIAIPKILEKEGRNRIANQILKTLEVKISNMKELNCLDVGCSSGTVTYMLSNSFRKTIGVDVDENAISVAESMYKKKNLKFLSMDAKKLGFGKETFDVIILNQVYEFVENPRKLAAEVYRVLKKGGLCYVGARNKISFIEGQTGIPLVHFLPQQFVVKLLRLFKTSYYPANYLNYRKIRKLFRQFNVDDLTAQILKNPKKYGYNSLTKYLFLLKLLPLWFLRKIVFLSPNFIFICYKV